MIVLEQCRIDYEGKNLLIEAEIDNLSYFNDVYIESVVIDTDKTYSPNGPSNNPVYVKNFEYNESPYSTEENKDCDCINSYGVHKPGVKKISLCLSSKDLSDSNLNDNIFFVYVSAIGIPSPDTPCCMDNKFVMGIAVNLRPIYNMAMQYIKELDNTCVIPKGFIDTILRIKAFDLSLRTGNYCMAFKQWDRLFKNKISIPSNRKCGCNGIN